MGPIMIFHITSRAQWDAAKALGAFRAASLDRDRFIHCSTRDQLVEVANELFRGRSGLVLLCIDPTKLRSRVVYEDRYQSGKEYPHIYGELNLDAVVDVVGLEPKADGSFQLPPSIR